MTDSVVLPDLPAQGRTRRIVAISIVAALAIGGGLAFAVTDDDDAPTYSLSEAPAANRGLKSFRFTVSSGLRGLAVTAEAEFDQENGLLHIVVALPEMSNLPELEMIVDLEAEVRYINRSFFGPQAPFDSEWLRIDELPDAEDDSVLEMISAPFDAIAMIDKAVMVEDLGVLEPDRVTPLEVGGVKVKEYRVTIPGEDVAAMYPQLESELEELTGRIPDEVLYHYYVDEQNIVRRVYFEIKVRLGTRFNEVTVLSINEPVQFELPSGDDVTNASDLP